MRSINASECVTHTVRASNELQCFVMAICSMIIDIGLPLCLSVSVGLLKLFLIVGEIGSSFESGCRCRLLG